MVLNLLADINNHWEKARQVDYFHIVPTRRDIHDEALENMKDSFIIDPKVTKKKDKMKIFNNNETVFIWRFSFFRYLHDQWLASKNLNPQDNEEDTKVQILNPVGKNYTPSVVQSLIIYLLTGIPPEWIKEGYVTDYLLGTLESKTFDLSPKQILEGVNSVLQKLSEVCLDHPFFYQDFYTHILKPLISHRIFQYKDLSWIPESETIFCDKPDAQLKMLAFILK